MGKRKRETDGIRCFEARDASGDRMPTTGVEKSQAAKDSEKIRFCADAVKMGDRFSPKTVLHKDVSEVLEWCAGTTEEQVRSVSWLHRGASQSCTRPTNTGCKSLMISKEKRIFP